MYDILDVNPPLRFFSISENLGAVEAEGRCGVSEGQSPNLNVTEAPVDVTSSSIYFNRRIMWSRTRKHFCVKHFRKSLVFLTQHWTGHNKKQLWYICVGSNIINKIDILMDKSMNKVNILRICTTNLQFKQYLCL